MASIPSKYKFLENEKSPRVLVEALKFMGVYEFRGTSDNPKILQWAKDVGLGRVYSADSIPWCGLFIAKVCKDAGVEITKDPLWALNWSKWGTVQKVAMLGDILTFKRNGGGHVGIYVGEDATCYHVLGGNQSDKVCITRIAKNRCYSIRRTKWSIAQPKNVRKIVLDGSGAISQNEA